MWVLSPELLLEMRKKRPPALIVTVSWEASEGGKAELKTIALRRWGKGPASYCDVWGRGVPEQNSLKKYRSTWAFKNNFYRAH